MKKGEKKIKKNKGPILWKYRIKCTGFIRRQTGFIRQRTGFIRQVDEASPPADEASPPTNEAISMCPFIFFLFCSFLKCFYFVCSESFTLRISIKKTLFLRTYVDLLNYPFK